MGNFTATVTKSDNVASGTIGCGYYGFGLKRFRISSLKLATALANDGSVIIANITDANAFPTSMYDCPIVGSSGFVGRLRFITDGSIVLYNLSGVQLSTSVSLTMSCMFT